MTTLLAKHFHDRRIERGLNLAQLATLAGYPNTLKGMNRLVAFEREGEVHPDLLRKLSVILDVDEGTIRRLAAEDDRLFLEDWNRWADEPVEPYAVVRMLACVYQHNNLPPEITSTEAAEAFAANLARRWKRKVCLVVSRRYSVWLDEAGEVYSRSEAVPGQPNTPYVRLGRSRQAFLIRSLTPDDFVRRVSWPKKAGPNPADL